MATAPSTLDNVINVANAMTPGKVSTTSTDVNSGRTDTTHDDQEDSGHTDTSHVVTSGRDDSSQVINSGSDNSTTNSGSTNVRINSGSTNTSHQAGYQDVTTNSGSVNTSQLMLSDEAVNGMVKHVLEGSQGLAALTSGQHISGAYGTTANQMMTDDLIGRTSAATEALRAKTVQTIGGSTSTTNHGAIDTSNVIGGSTTTDILGGSTINTHIGGNTVNSNTHIGGTTTDTSATTGTRSITDNKTNVIGGSTDTKSTTQITAPKADAGTIAKMAAAGYILDAAGQWIKSVGGVKKIWDGVSKFFSDGTAVDAATTAAGTAANTAAGDAALAAANAGVDTAASLGTADVSGISADLIAGSGTDGGIGALVGGAADTAGGAIDVTGMLGANAGDYGLGTGVGSIIDVGATEGAIGAEGAGAIGGEVAGEGLGSMSGVAATGWGALALYGALTVKGDLDSGDKDVIAADVWGGLGTGSILKGVKSHRPSDTLGFASNILSPGAKNTLDKLADPLHVWVLCTELKRQGKLEHKYYRYGARKFFSYAPQTTRGYYIWGKPGVKHLRNHPDSMLSKFLEHIIVVRTKQLAAEAGCPGVKSTIYGWCIASSIFGISWLLSRTIARNYECEEIGIYTSHSKELQELDNLKGINHG